MTLDEYNQSIQQLVSELQDIAQRTMQLAMSGSAHPGNPQFTELVAKQWALAQQMAQLNTQLMMGILIPKGQ